MCASLISHCALQRQPQSEPFRQGSNGGLHPLVLARIRSGAAHLHGLDQRAVAEALIELAKGPYGPAAVLDLLARYSRVSRAQVIAAGGDRPLPRQLIAVPR